VLNFCGNRAQSKGLDLPRSSPRVTPYTANPAAIGLAEQPDGELHMPHRTIAVRDGCIVASTASPPLRAISLPSLQRTTLATLEISRIAAVRSQCQLRAERISWTTL